MAETPITVPFTEEYDITLEQFVREAKDDARHAYGVGNLTPNEEVAVKFLNAMHEQVGPRTLEDAGRMLAAMLAPEVSMAYEALVEAGA